MNDSEDRRVRAMKMRHRNGETFVYAELPNWLCIAKLKSLEVDDWGVRATVLPLASVGLSSPPQEFALSSALGDIGRNRDTVEVVLCGVVNVFGEEIVVRLKSGAAELAHIPLPGRIPALARSLSNRMRQ